MKKPKKGLEAIVVPNPPRGTWDEALNVPGPSRGRATPGALRKQAVRDFFDKVMPRGKGIPVLPADSAQTEDMRRREQRQTDKAVRRRTSA